MGRAERPPPLYLSPTTAVRGETFGVITSPRQRAAPHHMAEQWWCGDCDKFTGKFDEAVWLKFLEAYQPYANTCLFIVAPDVIQDAVATLAEFDKYEPLIHALGFPVAFVTQDGLTPSQVPWNRLEALFVGGSDWHKNTEARVLIDEAKQRGKWVHIGRVNSRKRMMQFYDADSWDGTDLIFSPARATNYARWVKEARAKRNSPNMFKELAA